MSGAKVRRDARPSKDTTRAARSNALDRLVGRWEAGGRDTSAVFEVAIVAGKPVVTGFDDVDGERFKIEP